MKQEYTKVVAKEVEGVSEVFKLTVFNYQFFFIEIQQKVSSYAYT